MTQNFSAASSAASVELPGKTPRWQFALTVSCWLAATIILAIMVFNSLAAWDAKVYWKAIESLRHGADPYAVGLAAQQVFHDQVHSPKDHAPFTYVYSPMTLPLLRVLGMLPEWVLAVLYGVGLVGGFLLTLWVGLQMATEEERPWLSFMLPFAVFFPGLLCDDVVLSGNLVYGLYGLIFAAAYCGWTRGRWLWFYLAVLVASVCKAPLLTLLAFPILVGRRQWFSAGITGATGLALFSIQAWMWPKLFSEYMTAVRLQFDWNRDFGFGPAGVLARALCEMNRPYSPATTVLYLAFAGVLGIVLLALTHQVRRGRLALKEWIPVALVGTILLNPRVKEYDVAAITIPMLLIAWRMIRFVVHLSAHGHDKGDAPGPWKNRPDPALVLAGAGWFTAFNIIGTQVDWKATELGVLLGSFTVGACSLFLTQQEVPAIRMSRASKYEGEAQSCAVLR